MSAVTSKVTGETNTFAAITCQKGTCQETIELRNHRTTGDRILPVSTWSLELNLWHSSPDPILLRQSWSPRNVVTPKFTGETNTFVPITGQKKTLETVTRRLT